MFTAFSPCKHENNVGCLQWIRRSKPVVQSVQKTSIGSYMDQTRLRLAAARIACEACNEFRHTSATPSKRTRKCSGIAAQEPSSPCRAESSHHRRHRVAGGGLARKSASLA